MKAVQIVKNIKAPVAAGLHHRLMCMTGENKGICYYLKSARIILGRSKTADIQVLDVKSSREHLEIVKVGQDYLLTDLGSQNGTIVNDLKIKQHNLKDGDKIIIGKTVLKYNVFKISDFEEKMKSNENLNELLKEDDSSDDDESTEDKGGSRKKILIGVVVALVFFFLLGEDEAPKDKDKAKEKNGVTQVNENFSALFNQKKEEVDADLKEQVQSLLHSGLREHREGNYFRAIKEFERVLKLQSRHGRATYYLSRTKQALDDEIEKNFIKARREEDALKLNEATVSYCSIIRLLTGYDDDERFVNATNKIKEIENKLGLEEGEIKCL